VQAPFLRGARFETVTPPMVGAGRQREAGNFVSRGKTLAGAAAIGAIANAAAATAVANASRQPRGFCFVISRV
jgi:hypothetical protein